MTILDEARDVVYGAREKEYGSPLFNFETIADLWMVWLKRRHNVVISLLPDDVAVMMSLLKHARLVQTIDHHDTLKDIAGYIGVLERIQHPETVVSQPEGSAA